jgi:hypothetical protein
VDRLGRVVEPWQAAVIVALGGGAVGGALVAIGVTQLKDVELPPSRDRHISAGQYSIEETEAK